MTYIYLGIIILLILSINIYNNKLIIKEKLYNECLSDVKKILDLHKQKFFLVFGTLLGCVRDNKFLKHDYDVDLGIFYDGMIPNIFDEIKKSKKFKYNKCDGNICDSYVIAFNHINGTKLDINIFYNLYKKDYYCSSFQTINKIKKCYKWKFTINDLIKTCFYNKLYLIPSNYEDFLSDHYGKNWRIPKKTTYQQFLDEKHTNLISENCN